MSDYTCTTCGKTFELPPDTAQKYPNWRPKMCRSCFSASRSKDGSAKTTRGSRGTQAARSFTTAEVLDRFNAGPTDGIFTDGACSGNPGPGGWGAVLALDNEVVKEEYGGEPETTNNRMELQALIAGLEMVKPDERATIYSDSRLCVQTINDWAAGWERRGWRRKGGPVQNLDLVKKAFALAQKRPQVRLEWIKAHDGSRWNEYADALANKYLRERNGTL